MNYIKANSIHPDCSKLSFDGIKDILRQGIEIVFKPLPVMAKNDIPVRSFNSNETIVLKKGTLLIVLAAAFTTLNEWIFLIDTGHDGFGHSEVGGYTKLYYPELVGKNRFWYIPLNMIMVTSNGVRI